MTALNRANGSTCDHVLDTLGQMLTDHITPKTENAKENFD